MNIKKIFSSRVRHMKMPILTIGGKVKKMIPKALTSIALLYGAILQAESHVPTINECSKELLLSYFPEAFVKETLKKNQIPEDKWSAIVEELASNDKNVISKVESRANSMNPNPLKSPEYREQAIMVFREVLLEIFTDAMNKNGIFDKEQIQSMLDEVQRIKAKRFAQCMEKTRKELDVKTEQTR